MNEILVLTDFSEASENACDYAALLSSHFQIPLTALHIVAPSAIVHDSMFASVMITQAEIMEAQSGLMDAEMLRIQGKYGIEANGIVEEGFIFDRVTAFCQLHPSVLVVMGMKGKGKSNSIFGSTTTELIRKAGFPILVMPEKAPCRKMDRIVFATDFTPETSATDLKIVSCFAEFYKIPVTVLHVYTKGNLTAKEALGKMQASLRFSAMKTDFQSVANTDVVNGIQSYLTQHPCSLLVMTAHRHTLFQRVFGTIHTREMSYQASVPLLILKPE